MSKKTKKISPALPAKLAPISPAWITKTSPRGSKYRVCTIPLNDLPRLFSQEGFDPKGFFFYPPENTEVLVVRKTGETESRSL